ncbi:MAG TPA: hypothetical protein DD636_02475 [Anaerolineaceae bacterium]|jgi:hypothetical protein|nr:hypothetical protein [Anaerolineaceae bacterium]
MEKRGCFGCGFGCVSTIFILTILLLLVICGLIAWVIAGSADLQYQLHLEGVLLTAMVPAF